MSAVQTGCMLLLSFKLVPKVFGNVSVATLPFHPPGFVQKIAQRGLLDVDDPRSCSPVSHLICRRRRSPRVKLASFARLGMDPTP